MKNAQPTLFQVPVPEAQAQTFPPRVEAKHREYQGYCNHCRQPIVRRTVGFLGKRDEFDGDGSLHRCLVRVVPVEDDSG